MPTYDKDNKFMKREDCLSLPKLSNINRESNGDAMISPDSFDQNQSIELKPENINIKRV